MPKTHADVSLVQNESGDLFFNLRSDYALLKCWCDTYTRPHVLVVKGDDVGLVSAVDISALTTELDALNKIGLVVVWASVEHKAIDYYRELRYEVKR